MAILLLLLLCAGLLSGQDLSPDTPRELPALPRDVMDRLSAGTAEAEEPDGDSQSGKSGEVSAPSPVTGIETKAPAQVSSRKPDPPAFAPPGDPPGPYTPASQKTVVEQRLDTIRFGTENEIAALVQTLKNENSGDLDDALAALVQNTMNRNILSGVFSFFGERAKEGLEDRTLRALEDWDIEAADAVLSAVDYLGKLKVEAAIAPLKALLDAEERRFMSAAFKSLGRIGGGVPGESEEITRYLIDYYTNRNPGDENRRDIIAALGETGSPEGIELLSEIAGNNDERVPLRMAALEALAKIGSAAGRDAVLAGAASQDPNVRAAAVSALGPFDGPEVTAVILEAFRDSFYRTRIGAAQAAGTRKLQEAVPYLAYRAERDDVPQVKDEAIKALGAIGTPEAKAVLVSFFGERKNSDRVRILASEMLMRDYAEAYAEKLVAELDDAKGRNQTALYNGFLRVISSAKAPSLEAVTRRFLASGGVIEKSCALDMTANNEFRGLLEEVRALTDPKNGNLAHKAQVTLEKLDPSAKQADENRKEGST
ncbi:MAG: HEAT repeat domain-containing protein [Treponema sp.]|jgi:HEAT repeat protein|nr:HEAT repeat domain-containing protein [Treponema sp.]